MASSYPIDNETLARLEQRSALELTGPDRAEFADQMNAVLSCLDVLRACPDCVPPTDSAGCPLRADSVQPSTDRAAALANAPETDGTFFLVPRTVE